LSQNQINRQFTALVLRLVTYRAKQPRHQDAMGAGTDDQSAIDLAERPGKLRVRVRGEQRAGGLGDQGQGQRVAREVVPAGEPCPVFGHGLGHYEPGQRRALGKRRPGRSPDVFVGGLSAGQRRA